MAIDSNQTINICTSQSEKREISLSENKLFVGHQDCIHGGSAKLGRRIHGMFVPPGYDRNTQESETVFLTTNRMYP